MGSVLEADLTGNEMPASESFKCRSKAVEKSLDEIDADAEAASVVVNNTFDKIEILVTNAGEHRLRGVDFTLMARSEPFESCSKRIGLLDQKEVSIRSV